MVSAPSLQIAAPEMHSKKLVYVAGPYTIGNQVENVRRAVLAGERLIAEGFSVFVPHQSIAWEMISPHQHEFWMNLDLPILLRCDAVLRLPGESHGADREVELAKQKWIPVYYSMSELIRGMAPEGRD